MRTIELKVYSFEELSEEAKENAIQEERNNMDHYGIWDDAECTVKAFNNLFNLTHGGRSWLEYQDYFEYDVIQLKGVRLRTYILNNFGSGLYKRKYMGAGGDNKTWFHPCYKVNRYDVSKGARVSSSNFYYSRIQTESCCVLTGMCYDNNMLAPIYEFIRAPKNDVSFKDLLDECFESMRETIEQEIEYRESDEFISEELESNDYEFTEDGERY